MGPASVNQGKGPGKSLLRALQFTLHYEAVRVVGERTGLQADDVLSLCRPHDVDVGHIVPRKACTLHVDDTVVESLLVPALGGVVDGHAVHPIQRRDGEFEPLALRRLRLGAPYRFDNPLRDTPVELVLELFGEPAVYTVGALGRGWRTSGEQEIPEEAKPGEREYGHHKRGQPPLVRGTLFLHRPRPPFSIRYYGR